jgi:hypothetical protein
VLLLLLMLLIDSFDEKMFDLKANVRLFLVRRMRVMLTILLLALVSAAAARDNRIQLLIAPRSTWATASEIPRRLPWPCAGFPRPPESRDANATLLRIP